MSRRRYISSAISDDKVVARVEKKYGDFAGLLYDRMIPHAEDDGTITGDAEELLAIVFPHRRDKSIEDVISALEGIEAEKLISWDREGEAIYFPVASFYKYQAYIAKDKRRSWDYPDKPNCENGGNNNEMAENGGNNNSDMSRDIVDNNHSQNVVVDKTLAEIGGNNFSLAENGARARTPSVSSSLSVSSSSPIKEDSPPISPAGGMTGLPPIPERSEDVTVEMLRLYATVVPPTPVLVAAEAMRRCWAPGQGRAFFEHHENRGWKLSGRQKMRNWHLAMNTWERSQWFPPKVDPSVYTQQAQEKPKRVLVPDFSYDPGPPAITVEKLREIQRNAPGLYGLPGHVGHGKHNGH